MNVVVLTTVHPRDDNRVFYKELPVLASMSGVCVSAVVADGQGHEKREGYEVFDLGAHKNRLARFLLGNIRAFFGVKKLKPDAVHFHDPELMFLGVVFALMGVKVVFDVHENVPEDIKDKYWIPVWLRSVVSSVYGALESICVRFFSGVIAATPDIATRYPQGKVVLLQNFPRIEEFSSIALEPSSENSDWSIAYVGAITRIRGIDNVVKALAHVDERIGVRFKLAGFFQEEGHQQDLESLKEWSRVDFVGKVSRLEIGPFLQSARAGVVTFLPANNHLNAQPNKLFEYMAAGLPVIASDFPLWRKLIERYDCGYLVDPTSPESIAAAINEIVQNPELASAKGINGMKAIQSDLNWEVESKRLVHLYQRFQQQTVGGG